MVGSSRVQERVTVESGKLVFSQGACYFPDMPLVEPHHGDIFVRTFRANRKDIWYLHFIFEAYDGVASISTVDSREGVVEICIPASREEEAELLLRAICREITLEEVTSIKMLA